MGRLRSQLDAPQLKEDGEWLEILEDLARDMENF
jgi:hypothetical protein